MLVRILLFAAAATCAASAPTHAAGLFFRYGGRDAAGREQIRVLLNPDSATAVAVEIGFQFVGGSILAATPNAVVFNDLNPGQNPYTRTVSDGVSIHDDGGTANAAFAALGGFVPALGETLVLTLATSGPGRMTLGGQNHNGYFTGARVAQDGVNVNGLSAALEVTGFEANFDGQGRVDGRDLLIWQRGFGVGSGATASQGDADRDGKIVDLDRAIWEAQWGGPAPPASAATATLPEPSSWTLTALAFAAFSPRLSVRRILRRTTTPRR